MIPDTPYDGEWHIESGAEEQAWRAADAYLRLCKLFDRDMCGEDGIPKGAIQQVEVRRNALLTRERVCEEFHVPLETFNKALRYLRMRRKPNADDREDITSIG